MQISAPIMAAVAAGGAVGALGRYALSHAVTAAFGYGFPLATLVVNLAGSFAMGVLVELIALVWSPGAELRSFLVTGVLGAFTTFSTFSLDVASLIQRGAWGAAALYVSVSVAVGVVALFVGMALTRGMVS